MKKTQEEWNQSKRSIQQSFLTSNYSKFQKDEQSYNFLIFPTSDRLIRDISTKPKFQQLRFFHVVKGLTDETNAIWALKLRLKLN